MTGYLYCIEMGEVAKVGSTAKPNDRLASIRQVAPFDMKFRHLLDLGDARCAAAWETVILRQATRYRDRGEWVEVDDHLDDLFREVAPAVDVLGQFSAPGGSGRPIPTYGMSECEALIYKANLRHQVGPVGAAMSGDITSATQYQKGVIRARLSQGYGVEDIATMDNIRVEAARAEVRWLRATGNLMDVLAGVPPGAREMPTPSLSPTVAPPRAPVMGGAA